MARSHRSHLSESTKESLVTLVTGVIAVIGVTGVPRVARADLVACESTAALFGSVASTWPRQTDASTARAMGSPQPACRLDNPAGATVPGPVNVTVPVVRIADGGGTARDFAKVSIAKLNGRHFDFVVAAHGLLLLTISGC